MPLDHRKARKVHATERGVRDNEARSRDGQVLESAQDCGPALLTVISARLHTVKNAAKRGINPSREQGRGVHIYEKSHDLTGTMSWEMTTWT